jgi:Zn-dependent alcohol dehydrogenase
VEASAAVLNALGSAVSKVKPGDRVAISFASCGGCAACSAGNPSYCHNFMAVNYAGTRPDGSSVITNAAGNLGSSFFGQSSFASHALTSESNLVKVPDDFPLELAGPLGCGIQTGALVLGLTVKNIIEGDSDTFIPQLMRLHLEGRFPFDKLITTMPVEKINDGIAAQRRGEAVKVVLLLNPAD